MPELLYEHCPLLRALHTVCVLFIFTPYLKISEMSHKGSQELHKTSDWLVMVKLEKNTVWHKKTLKYCSGWQREECERERFKRDRRGRDRECWRKCIEIVCCIKSDWFGLSCAVGEIFKVYLNIIYIILIHSNLIFPK